MVVKQKKKTESEEQKQHVLSAILSPIAILILIGDGVREILRLFLSIIKISYINITSLKIFHVFLTKQTTDKNLTQKYSSYVQKFARFIVTYFLLLRYTIRLPKTPAIGIPNIPKPQWAKITPPFTLSQGMKGFLVGVILSVLFFFVPYNMYIFLRTLPNPDLLTKRDLEVSTKILDRNGILLYEIYADQNRTPIPLANIPKHVIDATIAIEDREFYKHQGFSTRGILRAFKETVLNKQLQGGSTITQQLIRSALLTSEVSLSRKLREVVLATWAELLYSKDEILEMYFNQVPYGGTAWGIESASRMYFGKSVTDLTIAEAALLAGLPAAPTEYSPFGSHPEKAFERQMLVLTRMAEDKYISKEQTLQAMNDSIHFTTPRVGIRAPHFVMYIRTLLEKRYGLRMVERGGLRVTTSLDSALQEKVEEIVKNNLDALRSLRVGNGAVLVTNPKTGEILAMVGSKDYFNIAEEGNVNVTTALRQPGSSIKVVNYAAALENGFTAATILDDSPVTYRTIGSLDYTPLNYDGRFHGLVPLRYALANSYNIPAVKVLAKIGVQTMVEKGRLMGITTWNDESRFGLSLTLGGGEVTMLDMAKVYGTLAHNGVRVEMKPILAVKDYLGQLLEHNGTEKSVQALRPTTAWIISNILSDNNARVSAFGQNSQLVIPGKTVSVKTGTSNDKRDNWTVGFTPSYVVTVWVGNNNNTPMDPFLTSGVTGAAPIWHDTMVEILKNQSDEIPAQPENVVSVPCYYGRQEYFVAGTQPANGRCEPIPTPMSPTPTP